MVLKEFGNRLSRSIRVSDLAVRMGGDEFLVILPECPEDRIPGLLARLGGLEVSFRGSIIPVRFSAGVAGFSPVETAEQMLERADQALYAQKKEKPQATGAAAPAL